MSKHVLAAGVVGCSTLLSLAACSNRDAEVLEPCPRRGATFRVQITASEGHIPRDARIRVFYGGSSVESYDLQHGNGDNQDVCCRTGVKATTLGGVPCDVSELDATVAPPFAPEAVQCELSTNGAARIEVRASGYPLIDETLSAQRSSDENLQHCDALVTRDVQLTLSRGDAGLSGTR